MSKTKKFFIGGFLACAVIFTVFLVSREGPTESIDAGGDVRVYGNTIREDIIGTALAPVDTSVTKATTTGYFKVDLDDDLVEFEVYAITASGTPITTMQVEKTATSSCNSSIDTWVDAIPQSSTSSSMVTLNAATTTNKWTPSGNGVGTKIQITNSLANCYKFTVGSASTTMWVQAIAKNLY